MKKLIIAVTAAILLSGAASINSQPHLSNYANNKTEKNDTTKSDTTAADSTKTDSTAVDSTKKKNEKKGEYYDLMKKDSTFRKGLFTVRHIEDKYYFDVPDSMLGRYFMAITRFTSVPQGLGKFAGEEVNENTLYFEKKNKKTMLLRAYVLTQIASEKDSISKTLKASTTDPIVAAFKIVQANPDSLSSMIEVTSLFQRENEVVGLGQATKQFKLGGLMDDRTFIDTMKVFPINIEVVSTRTYASQPSNTEASETGAVTIGLNTSMVLLPKTPMRKRLWDERVGYFTQSFTLFSDEQHKTEQEQMIARYNLVPKDIAAYRRGQLVEPVKPIIYYIDPATPKKWVPYLIKGINDWNTAFEAAGFKNAIQGREWPKDRPDMSVDDARYCVLRYLPAEIENAYGPHVSDPRSGEIIESHICWYHNVMSLLTKWYMTQCGPLDKRAQTVNMDDKLMGELIRFVSSHEVGHTLGLRHNMGASSATPVEKLRDKAWVEKNGHTASIMDYARFNYVAQPEDGVSEKGLFPRINDYDKWAIKWGYQYRPEFKDEYEEKEKLMTETSKVLANSPRLWFAGEGWDEDPRSQTEDLGDNSMKASDYGVKNLKRIMDNILTWTKQSNDQTDDLRDIYGSVRSQFNRYTGHVMKNLGGHYINNRPGLTPVEIAPASRQKEVFDWLSRNIFDAPLWLYPQSVTEKLNTNTIRDIENAQSNALSSCLNTDRMLKIHNDSYMKADAYTLESYIDDLFKAVWKPIEGNDISAKCRRTLERNYVQSLNSIINPDGRQSSNEVVLYLYQHLDTVEAFCKAQSSGASGINAIHYADLLNQINLIRERRTKIK